MSISMHQASAGAFVRGLKVLSHLLEKGAAHAAETGIDPSELIEARLAPDMLALAAQVQRVSDTAKLSGERLSGVAAPKMEDNETTFPQLQARIAKTIAYLEGLPKAEVDAGEDRTIVMNFGTAKPEFSGPDYLFGFALPNFYFHLVTAHDILRHKGVAVGKRDYLGPIA
ncbi:MAG: DUF1993 domain-containing protein [Phenylobacterium sp.]|uniref:DUF1993 domain-containing protein n=1 Tax=Phenylobacterium sp. TaxID=1871053 RepID=UPI001B448939|nr:DUF1993 domain-containing protein [Phenylobacterium sp.]MBP7651033.1 DUF1993 domain-containing protein [Phenylobacterium sp.]MBP7814697.1 DUF1993 domain-containing protein [Phenylobacterium sp.]MBP9756480.1 DUF1993 domain-containing protein [Phenylobacterium sp.]